MALTVMMLQNVTHLGTLYAVGTSPALADDLARQWVYEGRAKMVSVDTQALRTPAIWSDMTGGYLVKPDGTLIAKYNPAAVAITGGAINGATVGQTTPAAVKTSNLAATFTDSSATPGNVTNSSPRGRAAFAAGASSVVVTSTLVTAGSMIIVNLRTTDATLTVIETALSAAGSFTVWGNAAATAATAFDFLVVN